MHQTAPPWQQRYHDRIVTAQQAVRQIHIGDRVFIGSCAGTPLTLVEALTRRKDLRDTEIVHILTLGDAPYTDPRLGDRFRHNAFFIGANVREAVAAGRADYTPICLSEIPELFRERRVRLDSALISVSPPDLHGYCSLGVSCDIVKAAAESARIVIAEVNEQMPRTLGNCHIHVRDVNSLVPSDRALPQHPPKQPTATQRRIARKVAGLVEDGATLQVGVGTIPNTVLEYLSGYNNLGVHTETFSDGLIPLIISGAVNNTEKARHRGKVVTSFVMGSQALYDFVDDNPIIEFQPTEYVNDPLIIAQIDKMIAINSALEVDLTGQVCSDSLGTMFYSGVGSHVDFVLGAAHSRGGKPIIALPSTARQESISRIVPCLKQGAGVVTSRSEVRYVVTEYGVAYLHGKSIRERALALIQIAHPKFRPWLLAEAKTRNLVYHDQIEPPIRSPQYPETFEQAITLRDGNVSFMRPLRLTDEPLLRDMFYRLQPESIHSRFFRMLSALPHEQRQELLRVDYDADMALVMLTDSTESAEMIGIAHYNNDPKTNFADASFLVRDDWHGKGIATALLAGLIQAAQAHHIEGLTADVLLNNHGMLRVFQHCGCPIESSLEDGVYHLRMPFAEEPVRHEAPGQEPTPAVPPQTAETDNPPTVPEHSTV